MKPTAQQLTDRQKEIEISRKLAAIRIIMRTQEGKKRINRLVKKCWDL